MSEGKTGDRGIPRRGFASASGREDKARKILAILAEAGAPGGHHSLVLDIGTGNGQIAAFLAEHHRVVSLDVVDQRAGRGGFTFLLGADPLPFRDGAFDAVVSNHVIEHVPQPARHLAEIARVLKPGGVCYVATPNRVWPREPHYRAWLIHWLPSRWFESLLRLWGRDGERVRLFTWRGLVACIGDHFTVEVVSDRILRHPRRYFMRVPAPLAAVLGAVPAGAYRRSVCLHPTFIVLLRKPWEEPQQRPPQA